MRQELTAELPQAAACEKYQTRRLHHLEHETTNSYFGDILP